MRLNVCDLSILFDNDISISLIGSEGNIKTEKTHKCGLELNMEEFCMFSAKRISTTKKQQHFYQLSVTSFSLNT